LILKTLASLMFIYARRSLHAAGGERLLCRRILAGLVFGAIGDVCLNLRHLVGERGKQVFMAGIAAFLIGHLFYLFALIRRAPQMLLWSVPLCAVLSFFLLRFILKRIEVQGALKTFGIVYLVVVLFKDVLRRRAPAGRSVLNRPYRLFTLGAVLFAASDVLLVFNQFGKKAYPAFGR
jgi:uncharacterized membrane protein YhhN